MCSKSQFANVDLDKARIGGTLSLRGSKVTGNLDLKSIKIGEDLELNAEAGGDGASQFNDVDLTFASIDRRVFLDESEVTGILGMSEADIGSRLSMRSLHAYKVSLVGTHVVGTIDMTGSRIASNLDMRGSRADQNVFMGQDAQYEDVLLNAARIARRLSISAAHVSGVLMLIRTHTDEDLLLNNSEFAEVQALGAVVEGTLSLTNSHVSRTVDLKEVLVGGDILMYDSSFDQHVLLIASRVGGQLTLERTKIGGQFYAWSMDVDHISMDSAELSGPITLSDANIKGTLNLTNANIRSTIFLKRAAIGAELKLGPKKIERWSPDASLDMTGARVGLIPNLSDDWPPRLEIDGLTYQSSGGVPDTFANWFRSKLGHYSSQPYEQLASVIEEQGDEDLAKDIRYEGREARREHYCKEGPWTSCASQTILKYVIGYGYYPWWAAIWAVLFFIIGLVVLWCDKSARTKSRVWRVIYSLDTLLPVIELDDSNKDTKLGECARNYFFVHKLAGFILATFLVAALTGLTK
jgi:uncharacterized protein YjbI with pentapeptide repeats